MSTASLTEILVDDDSWASASPERRREWRVVLDELLAEHRFDVAPPVPLRLLVTARPERITLDARTVDGHAFARCDVQVGRLEEPLREYLEICRDMDKGTLAASANSPKLEALDIAKRLVHDEAAEALMRMCAPLRPDHATARRLFPLVVTLH